MEPSPLETPSVLPYRSAGSAQFDLFPRGRPAMVLRLTLGGSFCIACPIVGYALQNGPLFLIGVPLAFFGVAAGAIAAALRWPNPAVWILSHLVVSASLLTVAFLLWMVFVHGLC